MRTISDWEGKLRVRLLGKGISLVKADSTQATSPGVAEVDRAVLFRVGRSLP